MGLAENLCLVGGGVVEPLSLSGSVLKRDPCTVEDAADAVEAARDFSSTFFYG